jgi:hypothetical protein
VTERHLTDITPDEIRLLNAAMASIDADEVEGEALYLRITEQGRQWIVEAKTGQLVIDVADWSGEPDTHGLLPLSERVRRFADCFSDEKITLSIADDRTIVANAGSVTAAIDLVPQRREEPYPWSMHRSASVIVPMFQFFLTLRAARSLPTGIGEVNYPMPPLWMQFGDGWLGLHVDWTDFLPSRATYRIATSAQHGHTTTSIPHNPMEAFLQMVPAFDDNENELDLTITVGTVCHEGRDHEAISFEAAEWRLVLWLTHPLAIRWSATVNELLEEAEMQVIDADDIEWVIAGAGAGVRVKLHHGHPDIARVSTVLVGSVDESIEVLRELGQLNAASSGIRFWLEDGLVRAAADVRCTELGSLVTVIRQVDEAAATYAPMIAALGVAA